MKGNICNYRFRGICDANLYDDRFVLEGLRNNNPYFRGYYRSEIFFDTSVQLWKLQTIIVRRRNKQIYIFDKYFYTHCTPYSYGINLSRYLALVFFTTSWYVPKRAMKKYKNLRYLIFLIFLLFHRLVYFDISFYHI